MHLCKFAISSNIISLIIFARRYRDLKAYILLMNLSVADIIAGAFVVRLTFVYTTNTLIVNASSSCSNNNVLSMLLDLTHLGSSESMVTLALIAVERVYAVFKPLQHRVLKRRYLRCCVILTWCVVAIPMILRFIPQCNRSIVKFSFILKFVIAVISIIVMVISYSSIYIKLRFYPVFEHNASAQMQKRLLKTLFITTVASIATVLPFCGYYTYNLCCEGGKLANENAYSGTLLLVLSNSFINFFVYAWKMPDFGREVKKLVCYFCVKTNSVSEEHATGRQRGVASNTAQEVQTHFWFLALHSYR